MSYRSLCFPDNSMPHNVSLLSKEIPKSYIETSLFIVSFFMLQMKKLLSVIPLENSYKVR